MTISSSSKGRDRAHLSTLDMGLGSSSVGPRSLDSRPGFFVLVHGEGQFFLMITFQNPKALFGTRKILEKKKTKKIDFLMFGFSAKNIKEN